MRLSTFDLNLLRTLDVLLQEGSVTRAAERLHVTQQAMSGTLKRLREQFGDELLIQVGRRLEPTPLGSALLGPVHEVMLHIARMVDTTPSFDPALSTRSFKMAMSDYANLIVSPPMLAMLSKQAPQMTWHHLQLDPAIYQDLDAGTLDFGLLPSNWRLHQENLPSGIQSMTLFEDDFVCAVDQDSSIGETMSIDEYASTPHCVLRVGGGVRTIIDNAWTINRLVPRVAATNPSFINLLPMIIGTPMVATIPRRLAKPFAGCWPVRILECPIEIDRLDQRLNWHERNSEEPAHKFMRECYAAVAASLRSDEASMPN